MSTIASPTTELVRFVLQADPKAIPAIDRRTVARSCLDTIGVALVGARQGIGRIVLAEVEQRCAELGSVVLPTGQRAPMEAAAFVNGTLAHATEFDDYVPGGLGHATAPLFIPLLAVGESVGASGRELVDAYCIGFEAVRRLRRCCRYDTTLRGVHSTSIFGAVAATLACSRLLGLTARQSAGALAIAATAISGLVANFGTMTKALHMGMIGENAVTAVCLARDGFAATDVVLEAPYGLCETYLGTGNYSFTDLADALAEPYALSTSIGLKVYPVCGRSVSAVEAVVRLLETHDLHADDVERVDVLNVLPTIHSVRFDDPQTGLQGMFSLRYTVAVALLRRTVQLSDFPEHLDDAAVAQEMQKVRLEVLPRWDRRSRSGDIEANDVVLHLRDGRRLSDVVKRTEWHGSPGNPLSDDDVLVKFRRNLNGYGVADGAADTIAKLWLDLDAAANVAELTSQTSRLLRSSC